MKYDHVPSTNPRTPGDMPPCDHCYQPSGKRGAERSRCERHRTLMNLFRVTNIKIKSKIYIPYLIGFSGRGEYRATSLCPSDWSDRECDGQSIRTNMYRAGRIPTYPTDRVLEDSGVELVPLSSCLCTFDTPARRSGSKGTQSQYDGIPRYPYQSMLRKSPAAGSNETCDLGRIVVSPSRIG